MNIIVLRWLSIAAASTGCVLGVFNLIFRLKILSICTWIVLGFYGLTLILILIAHKRNKSKEEVVQRFLITTEDTRLTQYDYGKLLWQNSIVSTLKHGTTRLMIAFPINVTSVTTSFIQGFLSDYVDEHGWHKAKENINILGSTSLVKKFDEELSQR